ncbi:MAG TPA: YraN family protein [candidate division Zixibacteria bacterium]|nr:YraN family protein [candidate division Zixibacteria bacterium]
MTDPRHALGLRAEEAAAAWLTRQGWTVLERRWRGPGGELDLVCRDPGGTLVGVEVKLRTTGRAGVGAESVDRRRLGRLRRALAAYAVDGGAPATDLRLDLITLDRVDDGRWRLRHLPCVDAW